MLFRICGVPDCASGVLEENFPLDGNMPVALKMFFSCLRLLGHLPGVFLRSHHRGRVRYLGSSDRLRTTGVMLGTPTFFGDLALWEIQNDGANSISSKHLQKGIALSFSRPTYPTNTVLYYPLQSQEKAFPPAKTLQVATPVSCRKDLSC